MCQGRTWLHPNPHPGRTTTATCAETLLATLPTPAARPERQSALTDCREGRACSPVSPRPRHYHRAPPMSTELLAAVAAALFRRADADHASGVPPAHSLTCLPGSAGRQAYRPCVAPAATLRLMFRSTLLARKGQSSPLLAAVGPRVRSCCCWKRPEGAILTQVEAEPGPWRAGLASGHGFAISRWTAPSRPAGAGQRRRSGPAVREWLPVRDTVRRPSRANRSSTTTRLLTAPCSAPFPTLALAHPCHHRFRGYARDDGLGPRRRVATASTTATTAATARCWPARPFTHMHLRVTVDDSFCIRAIETAMDSTPMANARRLTRRRSAWWARPWGRAGGRPLTALSAACRAAPPARTAVQPWPPPRFGDHSACSARCAAAKPVARATRQRTAVLHGQVHDLGLTDPVVVWVAPSSSAG